ncbi:thioredoxin domain-containing protein [Afifella pfennigii]|uniref:thioredoxin domain-containing protein n=1 Tax=Afifella pfennigii TaxID=209897 RepID=UPI0005591A71|nr:thioredoxin domain-containing protein [Afifella pfennigii]
MAENRLAQSASPYLRQHADNPVMWHPWDEKALAEAARRNVPIHLSIGYAACHWCHVMAHESFSDAKTAELLNAGFVNIKVDREERPDIDHIYMRALHALGEPGGWPLTMFLTPAGEPFWGGTYFPPEPRFGRPSFRQLLTAVSETWRDKPDTITANTAAILQRLTHQPAAPSPAPDAPILDAAAAQMLTLYDTRHGGFHGAPKFPQAPLLELTWRAGLRTGNESFLHAVLLTLHNICQGGIYDHLGGGFARYAVDDRWLVPHFEKMLSDNGQLLSLLALAVQKTASPLFRARLNETADWLLRDMLLAEGAFAASLDADTENEEGATYVWNAAEITSLLGNDSANFAARYGVTPAGNWEGRNILNRLGADSFEWLGDAEEARLATHRAKLLAVRERRPQPARDYKILTDWNAVAIAGLARASEVNERPELLAAAEKAFAFLTNLDDHAPGALVHAWCDARATAAGLATDYAQMMRAALELYAQTGAKRYLHHAAAFFDRLETDFLDKDSGTYFLTADSAPPLILRPRSDTDEAMPNANGVAAEAAIRLSLVTSERRFQDRAEAIIERFRPAMIRDLIGTASVQTAWDTAERARHVTLAEGPNAPPLRCLVAAEADPALLQDALAAESVQGALRLCDRQRCYPDVVDTEAAAALLRDSRRGINSPSA